MIYLVIQANITNFSHLCVDLKAKYGKNMEVVRQEG